jgi:hypothetical protein
MVIFHMKTKVGWEELFLTLQMEFDGIWSSFLSSGQTTGEVFHCLVADNSLNS